MNLLNRFLFLSCKEATEAVEKQNVTGLSILEKVRLQKHLAVCHACNMYASFSIKADIIIKELVKLESTSNQHRTTSLEEKVLQKIFQNNL